MLPISNRTHRLSAADKRHLWHPFTPMKAWCAPENHLICLDRGDGPWLWDTDGNRYLDGNSSIWTNIHGHNHPILNATLTDQAQKTAHTSLLGFTNPPAIALAEKLTTLSPPGLSRVFYSDNGSTAVEVAARQALHYQEYRDLPQKNIILTFDQAYHGDTLGASSLGGIPLFHKTGHHLGYRTLLLKSPADLLQLPQTTAASVAAVIIEPLIQGAAGIKLWPQGTLRTLRDWCDQNAALLILDEVMTAFGRTGRIFACEHENITPDFLCLAKGLTGGYLPLAATLTTEHIFTAFHNTDHTDRTFYYGHSYCGNPLACAVALANLNLLSSFLPTLDRKIADFAQALSPLQNHPHVREIRRCGLVAGIELCHHKSSLQKFPPHQKTGAAVCLAARPHGLLTRPILDTIILMPPLCCEKPEFDLAVTALHHAISSVVKT